MSSVSSSVSMYTRSFYKVKAPYKCLHNYMPWDPLKLDIFSGKLFKLSIFVENTQKGPPDFGCSKTRRADFTDDLSCRRSGVCGVRFRISAVRISCHEGKAEIIFLPWCHTDRIHSIMAISTGGQQAVRCRAADGFHILPLGGINSNTGNTDRGH